MSALKIGLTGGVFEIFGQLWTVFGHFFKLFWPQKWPLLAVFLGLLAVFLRFLAKWTVKSVKSF